MQEKTTLIDRQKVYSLLKALGFEFKKSEIRKLIGDAIKKSKEEFANMIGCDTQNSEIFTILAEKMMGFDIMHVELFTTTSNEGTMQTIQLNCSKDIERIQKIGNANGFNIKTQEQTTENEVFFPIKFN